MSDPTQKVPEAASVVADEPGGGGIDAGRISDSVQQGFQPGPIRYGEQADGLPGPMVATHLPLAPPLALSTMVCLADTSCFVLRRTRWGDELARFRPEEVERAPDGSYFVGVLDAVGAGVPWIEIWRHTDLRTGRVRVEPKRPQCAFLRQQLVDFHANPSNQITERLCTARRDEDSFFLSLMDSRVHACELRSPPDQESAARIETFNETKLALGAERIRESEDEFDVDRALKRAREEAAKGIGHSGIFGSGPKG